MRIDVITCLPAIFESPLQHSIMQRAQNKGIVSVHIHDLRDYSDSPHRQIDDYPFGGGAGMVIRIEPIAKCIRTLQSNRRYDQVIFLTPDGESLKQSMANEISLCENLIIMAGHYKGIDQRARDLFVTREISVGDYVLTGGELPALILIDSIVRLLPGVLNDETSALMDSFQDGLLEAPIYTRPADFEGNQVPDILLSGHFAKIDAWRDEQAYLKTSKRRPDLLDRPTKEEST